MKDNQRSNIALNHFLYWIVSIIWFDCSLFILQENSSKYLLFFGLGGLLITAITGFINFYLFVSALSKEFHNKFSNTKAEFLSFFAFILFLIFGLMLIFMPFYLKTQINTRTTLEEKKPLKNILITSGLKVGSEGISVSILQSALAQEKDIYPSGLVSGYFGELTRQAVVSFQKRHNLTQSGEIDELSANKFNEVYGNKTSDYYLSNYTNTNTTNTTINTNTQTYVDSDPEIDCQSTYPNCVGQSIRIRRSACSNITCCQIGNNWSIYTSRDKCHQDQNAFNNQNKNTNRTYTFPTYAPLPTWPPLPTYNYPTYAPYPTVDYSTPTPYIPQMTKSECQSQVNTIYGNQMRSYGCAYPCPESGDCGSTSVCEGMWYVAQQEMSKCNQYP